jgi:GAF domain-containing protein
MEMTNDSETELVLRAWRARILNGFLTIAAITATPAWAMTIVGAFRAPEQWRVAASLSVVFVMLIALTVFRGVDSRIRVWGLLLLGYVAATVNMAAGGIQGRGPWYLLVLPILTLILVSARASILTSGFSVLVLAVFAFLFQREVLVPVGDLTGNLWSGYSTFVMLLAVSMALLVLFHRFQVKTLEDQRRTAGELDRARSLLEEQNAILDKQVRERTQELIESNQVQSALYRIDVAASTAHDLQEFYADVHRIVGELMHAANMFIALYDEPTGLVSFPYCVNEKHEPLCTQPLEDLHGVGGYVLRTGESIKHGWDQIDQLVANWQAESADTLCEDGIGVPLKANGRILGAIVVQSYTKGIRYTDKDDEVLAFVAQHIATALTRIRAIEETRKRNSELQIINRVQEGLAYKLDFQGIIDLIGEQVGEIFGADTTSVAMYDEERDWVSNVYYVDRGQRIPWPDRPASRPSLGVIVLGSRKPLLIGTKEESLRLGGLRVPRPGDDVDKNESYLGVPILAEGQPIGLITIQSYEQNAYKQDDVRLLQMLANSMSIALENARLFDETQRLLKETERRNNELAILNSIGEAMSKTLDLKIVTRIVGDKVRDIFDADTVVIMLLDSQTNLIHVHYEFDRNEGGYIDYVEPFPLGTGLA